MTIEFARHAWLGSAAIACIAAATPAAAQTKTFDIPAQSASSGIAALGRQADVQIAASRKTTQGKRTNAVGGAMTIEQALGRLLAGTGLAARNTGAQTWAIVVAPRVQQTSMQTGPERSAVASAGTAQSGEGDAGSAAANDESAEIVVTAQKRQERLIDAPLAVTALTSEDFARSNATQFRDFANQVPGLSYQTFGAGYTQIILRGVTTGTDVGPAVAVYVDEVPYGSSSVFAQSAQTTLDAGLFDLERVEVLRGPQGTLYGASAMGGLLKYVTKRPDLTRFGGEAKGGLSFTKSGGESYDFAAAINAPLAQDVAAVRVSGFYSHDAGFIDNVARGEKDVNSANVYGGRIDLYAEPTDGLSVRLVGFLQNIKRGGESTADYGYDGQPLFGALAQNRPFAEPFDQKFRLLSGTLTYDLGSAELTSVSSYQYVRNNIYYDFSAAFVPTVNLVEFFGSLPGYAGPYGAVGNPVKIGLDKFTQELRLAGNVGDTFEYLVGGFYTHEKTTNVQGFDLLTAAGQPAPNIFYSYSTPSRYKEIAGFGNLTWHVTDRLQISGGLRWAQNKQRFEQIGSGAFVGSVPEARSKDSVVTWLANASYKFGSRATAYVRYATGYRPGGPNFVINDPTTGLPLAPRSFEADTLTSYEAGFKAETSDRTFGIDLAGYYIDWNNIQVTVTRGGLGAIINAPGGAHIKGAELTLTARPSGDFSASGSFAFQDAKIAKADADLGARKGERLPNVPKFTATVNADYVASQSALRPTLGATLRYVSDRDASFDASSSPQYHLPDYVAVDLRAGIRLGPVDAQIYVRNLFDERAQLSSLFTRFATSRVAIMQPRTIGASLRTRF
jgi:outer membrane receptor protein involved in Fe transport